MRDSGFRPEIKNLYILGAGASYSASLKANKDAPSITPLDNNFCQRIHNLDYVRPNWIGKVVRRTKNMWIDNQPFITCGLESSIIRQLSHMQFFERINKRRKIRFSSAEYLNDLAHIITFILQKCSDSNDGIYKKFVNKVFPSNTPIDEGEMSRIITFNYDDLLDRHLLNRYSPERVYFDRLRKSRNSSARRTQIFREPLLLKLHGSITWRCTKDEFEKIIDHRSNEEDRYWIDNIWYSDKLCPSPDDDESPCIVPPIPDKPMTQIRLFEFLWTRACEYLHEAENIIICGYSLPDTDALAMSLFGNLNNTRLKTVTVIDPDPSILQRWRELLITPKNSKARWIYHSDFREYVESL